MDSSAATPINKPIFVVGSPRSGTSILTWCLGQDPNIVPLPESGWMGDFAIDLAIRYQIGAARGNRSILSAMDIQREEFFAHFGQSINDLILNHRKDLERKRSGHAARAVPNAVPDASMAAQPGANRKTRWVDGTPEYSLHIYGLRKLFPDALFVHLFRDVSAVVRSMLNFHRVAGTHLVANEEEAYRYWLRTVRACLKAERAYGPGVVYRLPYAALVENPEPAMRSLLDFLDVISKSATPKLIRTSSSRQRNFLLRSKRNRSHLKLRLPPLMKWKLRLMSESSTRRLWTANIATNNYHTAKGKRWAHDLYAETYPTPLRSIEHRSPGI